MQLKKLRVGVWVPENYRPTDGGGFSLFERIIKNLNNYNFEAAEIIFVSFSFDQTFIYDNRYTFKNRLNYNIAERILKKIGKDTFGTLKSKQQLQKEELKKIIDIIYYPIPTFSIPAYIENFPYVTTLWDLSHIACYNFPELSMNGVYEFRKPHLQKITEKALMLFTESETGKKQAQKFLNINPDKISVIPLFPSDIIADECAIKKPDKLLTEYSFIHYPAQYWAHKNHYNLILAFAEVKNKYPELKLVLSGADKGNKTYVFEIIRSLGLTESVVDLQFVEKEELKWIYLNSSGLVMPTFLGPTNMPIIEAASLNCPVACSDFDGHREQLGDTAYYFDPASKSSIAAAIIRMLDDKPNRIDTAFTSNYFTVENAMETLDQAFTKLRSIRFCWGDSDEIF